MDTLLRLQVNGCFELIPAGRAKVVFLGCVHRTVTHPIPSCVVVLSTEDNWFRPLPIYRLLDLCPALGAFPDHLVLIETRRRHRRDHVRNAHRLIASWTQRLFGKHPVLGDHGFPPRILLVSAVIPCDIPHTCKRVVVQCITLRKHLQCSWL
jgi:hypothetical protein